MTKPLSSDDPAYGLALETLTAQALGHVESTTRSLVPPIFPSSTYERDADGGYSSGRGYSRPHNPTYDEPESLLATLEGGQDCLLFASGMAAATAVFQALLPGDHVIAPRFMYWALRTWLVDFAVSWGLDVQFVETTDLAALDQAVRPGHTKLIWLDTPANPTWDVTDIEAVSAIARRVNARLVVDNTVATPVLLRPIEWGADLVVHSATKYLNGHSDVVAGAVVAARDDSFWQRIRAWRRDAGAIMGPFEAWLLLRGMRTLFVRVRRCCETAQAVAAHFEGHPAIRQVLYPGLVSHAGHAVASRQMVGGYGGMLSLRLVNGEAAAMATAANLKVFKRATSLGGVESLVEHRASIEGPSTPVPTDLLRFSMGLEDAQDLIADLEAALAEAEKVQGAVRVQDIVRQAYDPSANVAEKVGWVLTHYIRPLVLERGGDLELRVVVDGAVIFGVVGSPGASLPLRGNIQALLSHYVPQINRVEFTTVGDESDAAAVEIAAIAQDGARIEEVISKSINPALAGHGGLIELDRVEGKDVYLLFGGRCQGCAMANLTFRQGVEVMLKRAIPDMASVIDATDHTLGTDPYFKTKKA